MKIIQITDTHLSPAKRHFNGNWAPLAEWIESEAPDLVVHTGDLSVDGADHDDDLVFARDRLAELTAPVLIVPGNHDVGHSQSAQPVDAVRLRRWRDLVGPDRWAKDHGDWRLLGMNSLLLGLGTPAEAEQADWLDEQLASRGGRRVAVFAHKPLFVDEPDEGETGYWGAAPAPRRRLLDLFARHEVALHASGHLHRAHTARIGATALVWAPSSSFHVGPMAGRDLPGASVLGAAVHHLGEELRSTIVVLPGLAPHLLDDVLEEVYPTATMEPAPARMELAR